jgi:predicted phage terminase large subunit-like protein
MGRELQAVAEGKVDRLMIFMPPGHAKSTYGSMLFPPWFMSRQRGTDVILAAYNGQHAEFLSSRAQTFVRENTDLLGYTLISESRKMWTTTNRSLLRAAGIGGGIAGRRADLAVIDDPHRGRKDAESATERNTVWSWYRADLLPRLKPGGRIVLIQTRWHEDDLAGRLLADDAKQWRVIDLPAICETENDALGRAEGDALWPQWMPRPKLDRLRKEIGEREWASLYQQKPAPPEGALFLTHKIQYVPALPIGNNAVVRHWDQAATVESGGMDPDWTVGAKLIRIPDGRFVIADIIRFRGSPADVESAIVNTAHGDGRRCTISIAQEPGSAGKGQAQYLATKLAGYQVKISRETGDKATRAMPLAAQIEAGNVMMLTAGWNATLLDELGLFPYGRHDDQVDALAGAFTVLTDTRGPMRISADLIAAFGNRPIR